MGLKCYRDLVVWRKSLELAEAVYRETRLFPKEEVYGLTSQIRRAVVSIPSNIAEGQGRSTRKDFRAFLCTSRGSVNELRTQLELSYRLGILNGSAFKELTSRCDEIGRMLNGLIGRLGEITNN